MTKYGIAQKQSKYANTNSYIYIICIYMNKFTFSRVVPIKKKFDLFNPKPSTMYEEKFKDTKGKSEAVNPRRTDNKIAKRKRTNNDLQISTQKTKATMAKRYRDKMATIYKTMHRKEKNE